MSVTGTTQLAQPSGLSPAGQLSIVAHRECGETVNRFDRAGLMVLATVFVLFVGLVQFRSALYPPRRLGDWNVFARAAWAARTGGDIYTISDDNGFHYLYPPTFAILLAPFADAPPDASRAGLLPYPLTVLYWYFFNVACLAVAAHWLASALEEALPEEGVLSIVSRRWWGLHVWPLLACLPPIGHTLMRGQVGILLLLFLSGMIAAAVRGRSARAGGWLACAICLKVIPAFLLVYPLVRRDVKFLGGCVAGLLIGLVAIPLAARGPEQTWDDYRQFTRVVLAPSFGGDDSSRAKEVLDVTATDSQSFLAMFHNTLHFDRATRPRQATLNIRLTAVALSAAMLAALIIVSRGCRRGDSLAEVIFWGAMIEVMLLASPVCHLHYFCLSLPVMAAMFAANWQQSGRPRIGLPLAALVAVNLLANSLPHFPGMEACRDVGIAGYAAVLLIAVAILLLRRRHRLQCCAVEQSASVIKAAGIRDDTRGAKGGFTINRRAATPCSRRDTSA
jgi:alpha-1,2-mannosyltransferase